MKKIFKTGNILKLIRSYINEEISISYLVQSLNKIVDEFNKVENKLITKEWLIKKGFEEVFYEYHSVSEYHLKDNKYLKFVYCEDFSLAIGDENDSVIIEHSLTIYQHQFENIYYCLTGKRL